MNNLKLLWRCIHGFHSHLANQKFLTNFYCVRKSHFIHKSYSEYFTPIHHKMTFGFVQKEMVKFQHKHFCNNSVICLDQILKENRFDLAIHYIKDNSCGNIYDEKVLLKLISYSSRNGKENDLNYLIGLVKNIYLESYEKNHQFSHYKAECKWINGDFLDSLNLFYENLVNNSKSRGKVTDLMKFFVMNLLTDCNDRSKRDIIVLLYKKTLILSKLRIHQPVIMIWREFFLCDEIFIQEFADNILKSNDCLKTSVPQKVKGIVNIAFMENKVNTLYRLLQLCLFYDLDISYISFVFEFLIKLQCINNDINGVLRIVKHAETENILLKMETIRCLLSFYSLNGIRIPEYVMRAKHTKEVNKKEFKF